jgi:hypothetical protein
MIKLHLNIPDFTMTGQITNQIIELKKQDYSGKTIKQVVSKHLFSHLLEGQDESIVNQTLDLVFNFIQPKGVTDISSWWEQPFETLVTKGTNEITLDLDFTEEGKAFIQQMQ